MSLTRLPPLQALDPDLDAIAALTGTGILCRTATDTWSLRTLLAPAAGLTIANPAGVAGNPTFALANDLAAVEALATTGLAARTAADAWATRTITSANALLTVSNGDGVAGNPSLTVNNASIDHGLLAGLADDDHTQYLLLAGRAGTANNPTLSTSTNGTILGSTLSAANLILNATSGATPGSIQLHSNVTTHPAGTWNQVLYDTNLSMPGLSALTGMQWTGTWTATGGITSGSLLSLSSIITSDGIANRDLGSWAAIQNVCTWRGATTAANSAGDNATFWDEPTYDTTGGGALLVNSHATVRSEVAVLTGVTLSTRRGLHYRTLGTTGTISTSAAVDVETVTATTRLSLRSSDTATELRHAGAIVSGGNVAANAAQILDIVRDIAYRAGADFAAANGANADIPTTGKTFFRWTGGGALQTMDGFAGEGINGKRLVVYNASANAIAVTNESAGEAILARRITVPAATTIASNRSINLMYSTATSRWIYAQ